MNQNTNIERSYYPHITGLRAIAVISIIIYHYDQKWLPYGFLGVDIFFVISGFVISNYLANVSFSSLSEYLSKFYLKRIKRLLPALLVCVFVTSICMHLVTTEQSNSVFKTGALSLLGLSNFYLFHLSQDYFALNNSLNIFAHTWSLAIEEQFYLFFPLMLYFIGLAGRRSKLGFNLLILITFISFLVYLFTIKYYELASFYLLTSRAWELGVGAIAYFVYDKNKLVIPSSFSFLAFLSISVLLFLTIEAKALITILIVICTSILVVPSVDNSLIHRLLTLKWIIFIGLISYSLYIWHWPILVIGRITIGVFSWSPLLLLSITILVSILSYFYIEQFFRYKTMSNGIFKSFFSYLVIASITATFIWMLPSYPSQYNLTSMLKIKPVYNWIDELECQRPQNNTNIEKPLEYCLGSKRTKDKPYNLYLVGDSHAAQFSFMFNKALEDTKYTLRFINYGDFPNQFVTKDANSKVFDYIVKHSVEGDVLVLSFYRGHLNDEKAFVDNLHIPMNVKIEPNEKSLNFIANFSKFSENFKQKKLKILFIKDTPLMSSIISSPWCLMQNKLFGRSGCQITKEQDTHTRKRQDIVIDELATLYSHSCIWNPNEDIYNNKTIFRVADDSGHYLMRDWNHISKYLSLKLASNFKVQFNKCF